MVERIPLTDMENGEDGVVVDILGGMGVHKRLKALGIRPGVKVSKVNATFARGPVILRIGRAQTALGFGVSYKIIVEVER